MTVSGLLSQSLLVLIFIGFQLGFSVFAMYSVLQGVMNEKLSFWMSGQPYPTLLNAAQPCPTLPNAVQDLPNGTQRCPTLLNAAQLCPTLCKTCLTVPNAGQRYPTLPCARQSPDPLLSPVRDSPRPPALTCVLGYSCHLSAVYWTQGKDQIYQTSPFYLASHLSRSLY